MSGEGRSEVTAILERLRGPETQRSDDHDRLLRVVYPELRRMAVALMAKEQREVTLQPIALVHEAYLRLAAPSMPDWEGRAHFLAYAARCMRNVLIDHARARRAGKRGGALRAVTLDDERLGTPASSFEALALHDALTKLEALDPRAARIAELRLFGGMTIKETAHALELSSRTVDDDWATARLGLSRELRD